MNKLLTREALDEQQAAEIKDQMQQVVDLMDKSMKKLKALIGEKDNKNNLQSSKK